VGVRGDTAAGRPAGDAVRGQLELDLFGDQAGQVQPVTTPASPHGVHIGWAKNPDPRAWEINPATNNPYPVSAEHPFHLIYIATCLTCGWVNGGHDRENGATEAAMDHAWPGWRTLPVTAKPQMQVPESQLRRWYQSAVDVYPPGWIEAGGPVRTWRQPVCSRSHWDAHYGFWDIGVIKPESLELF
jgi:hypothetical protein